MFLADAMPTTQAHRRQMVGGEYDRWLLLAIVSLASIGVVMVTSSSIAVASTEHLGAFYYLRRHLMFLLLGGTLMVMASRIELRWVEKQHRLMVVGSVLLLLAVFLPGIGMRINGAQRWLDFGISSFQPVEVVKVVVVLYVASYMTRHREVLENRFYGTITPLAVVAAFCILMLAQPDFGSAVLVMAVCVAMIWLGGGRMRYLLMMGASLIPVVALLALSESYRVQRFTSFLDPWKDPFDNGFQLVQSLIAVGRGEWFGVGLGASVQKLSYLPEAHTDFILAVIAEELGLFGVLVVLGLYALLVVRGLMLGLRGMQAKQRFAACVAFGASVSIGLQAMVSAGVNLGVLPTKGLTLPLISSGGSSVVMTCCMLGLLLRASYEIARAENQRAHSHAAATAREAVEVDA